MSVIVTAQHFPRPAASTNRIEDLAQKLRQSPDDKAIRDSLAGAYLQKMRETADGSWLTRATQLIEATLKTDPSNYQARRRNAEVDMQLHRFREVVRTAGALVREQPTDSLAWGLLGDAQMELGLYNSAADSYQKMADLRPSMASYNRVAWYRFVTGDALNAIEIMKQAIRMGSPEPENVAWSLADLGNMQLKTSAYGAAEQSFRQALALFPGYHHALAGIARLEAAQGRYQQAVPPLLEAQAHAPFPEYAGLLALFYRKLGKEDLAKNQIALLDVADKLNTAAGESANRNLALAFADLGYRTGRALALARAELDVRRDVYTYDALAWCLFRAGYVTEANEAMKIALSEGTPEPGFREHAARISASLPNRPGF